MLRLSSPVPAWLWMGVLACLSACTDSSAQDGDCPDGTTPYEVTGTTPGSQAFGHRFRWCRAANGLATGPFHEVDAQQRPVTDGAFDHGLAEGVWRFWNPTGTFVASERSYLHGQPHGTWTTRLDATIVDSIHLWAYGKPCGDWQSRAGNQLTVQQSWPACASIAPGKVPTPVADPDRAPLTVDFGWPGTSGPACPGQVVKDPDPDQIGKSCVDAEGRRNGPYARWYSTSGAKGARWVDGSYHDDLPSGTWRTWFASGALQSQGDYSQGHKTGTWRTWYGDGSPATREDWLDGQRHGASKAWHPGGVLHSQGSYVHGVQVGDWKTSWPTGTPATTASYDDQGRLHGAYASFFEGGGSQDTGSWDHGVRTGPWQSLYPDGKLAHTGPYVGGVPEGTWQYGLANGDPDTKVTYVHGVGEGESQVWHREDGGLVRTTVMLVHAVPQGPAPSVWDGSGKKQGLWTYVDGQRDGAIQTWHENGQLSLDGWFVHGAAHGPWTTWYPGGQVHEQALYLFGFLDGPYAEWFQDGKPRVKGSYLRGIKVGAWQTWSEDGTVKTTTYDGQGNPTP